MDRFISRSCWMRDIPDDTPVTTLSIPGTHDSGCIGGPFGFAQTQNLGFSDQLEAGISFLDIRLARCEGVLCIHHDVVCMGKTYADVLGVCSRFLDQYPSETILMSVKDEDYLDGGPGRFAPSAVFRKLSLRDVTDGDRNARSFEDAFTAETGEHVEDVSLFYNFPASSSGSDSMTTGCAFTSETTLGAVRGKIILLRRFEGSDDVGLDLTYWPDNQRLRSASPPFYDVHDRYQGLEDEEKYELVIAHLEDAKRGDPDDLYITFSSAVDLKALGYAQAINSRLSAYLRGTPRGRVGIIVMDYFEQPQELVSHVIEMNCGWCDVCTRSGLGVVRKWPGAAACGVKRGHRTSPTGTVRSA